MPPYFEQVENDDDRQSNAEGQCERRDEAHRTTPRRRRVSKTTLSRGVSVSMGTKPTPWRAQKDSTVRRHSSRRWPYRRMASLFNVTETAAPLSRSISRTSPPSVGRSSWGDSVCSTTTSPDRAARRAKAFSQLGESRSEISTTRPPARLVNVFSD